MARVVREYVQDKQSLQSRRRVARPTCAVLPQRIRARACIYSLYLAQSSRSILYNSPGPHRKEPFEAPETLYIARYMVWEKYAPNIICVIDNSETGNPSGRARSWTFQSDE